MKKYIKVRNENTSPKAQEYETAFNHMVNRSWERFSVKEQDALNKELNRIFKLNTSERIS